MDEDFKRYMQEGYTHRIQVMSKLAVIEAQQLISAKYQAECDVERKNHEKRLNTIETRGRTLVAVFGSTGLLGLLTAALEYFKKG